MMIPHPVNPVYRHNANLHRGLLSLLAYAQHNPVAHQWIGALLIILQRQGVAHG